MFGILILVLNLLYFVPNMLQHDGMMLENIGTYQGTEYAFGNGRSYGLYSKTDGEYQKISKYAPISNEYIFFANDKIYYTARTLEIVQVDLNSYEEVVYDAGNKNLLLGLNDEIFVVADAANKSITRVVLIDGFNVLREIDAKVKNVNVNDGVVEFIDDDTLKQYKYIISTDVLEEE